MICTGTDGERGKRSEVQRAKEGDGFRAGNGAKKHGAGQGRGGRRQLQPTMRRRRIRVIYRIRASVTERIVFCTVQYSTGRYSAIHGARDANGAMPDAGCGRPETGDWPRGRGRGEGITSAHPPQQPTDASQPLRFVGSTSHSSTATRVTPRFPARAKNLQESMGSSGKSVWKLMREVFERAQQKKPPTPTAKNGSPLRRL